uniref:(northern house mosquito) hypothetical protein n=1 Tax=Culex pipiens TaxID=7175 RepID=A0A8D8FGZ8_CULPI
MTVSTRSPFLLLLLAPNFVVDPPQHLLIFLCSPKVVWGTSLGQSPFGYTAHVCQLTRHLLLCQWNSNYALSGALFRRTPALDRIRPFVGLYRLEELIVQVELNGRWILSNAIQNLVLHVAFDVALLSQSLVVGHRRRNKLTLFRECLLHLSDVVEFRRAVADVELDHGFGPGTVTNQMPPQKLLAVDVTEAHVPVLDATIRPEVNRLPPRKRIHRVMVVALVVAGVHRTDGFTFRTKVNQSIVQVGVPLELPKVIVGPAEAPTHQQTPRSKVLPDSLLAHVQIGTAKVAQVNRIEMGQWPVWIAAWIQHASV